MNTVITDCPNCQSSWGFEEMQWGECDCCGYPNIENEKVQESKCVECNCDIQIADEAEQVAERNAIAAFAGEDDDYIGGICWDCADKLCNEGRICISGGGNLAPDAHYMPGR